MRIERRLYYLPENEPEQDSSTSELLDNAVVGDGLAYKGREV
jgi:hypothetical protein